MTDPHDDRPPPGHHWEWRPDPAWRVITPDRAARSCRWGAGYHRRACGQPAAAEMNRRRHNRNRPTTDCWWAYCTDHLYGRRITDGVVQRRVLMPDDDPKAGHR
jgi:hypothetical protein